MKIFQYVFFATIVVMMLSATAWGQAKPATEERLIRVEEGVKNLDRRIDDTNKRIDDLRTDIVEMRSTMVTGFGVLLSGMFALVGFVIWDRRTALAPVARQAKELAEFDEKTLTALREFAKTNKVMQEALKKVGML